MFYPEARKRLARKFLAEVFPRSLQYATFQPRFWLAENSYARAKIPGNDHPSQAQKPAGDLRDKALCALVQSRAERIQRPLRHDLCRINQLEGFDRIRNAKFEGSIAFPGALGIGIAGLSPRNSGAEFLG